MTAVDQSTQIEQFFPLDDAINTWDPSLDSDRLVGATIRIIPGASVNSAQNAHGHTPQGLHSIAVQSSHLCVEGQRAHDERAHEVQLQIVANNGIAENGGRQRHVGIRCRRRPDASVLCIGTVRGRHCAQVLVDADNV